MSKVEDFKFTKYDEYIDLGMYEEMFGQIKKDAEKIGEESEPLEKQKYINAFFMHIFSKKFYDNLNKKGNAGFFYPLVFEKLDTLKDYELVKRNIGRLIDSETANLIFKELMLKEMSSKAIQILPYISNNAQDHEELFMELSKRNMEYEFKFMLEKMTNIRFNNDRLLLEALDMNPSFANYMIGHLGFDINKVPESDGSYKLQSFVYSSILEGANGHLKNLMVNHLEKINMGVTDIPSYGRMNMISFVKAIKPSYEQIKIFLAPEFASKITTDDLYDFLFESMQISRIEEFIETDIFKDIFKHPNFKSKHHLLRHSYLFHEMLGYFKSNIVGRATSNTKDVTGALLEVFHEYLEHANDLNTLPDTKKFNVLGSVIYAYLQCSKVDGQPIKNKEFIDVALMTAKRFPHLINEKNPRGDYVLDMTAEGSDMHKMLKRIGAEGSSKTRSLLAFAGIKAKEIKVVNPDVPYMFYQEKVVHKAISANATYAEMIAALKMAKEDLWKDMQNNSTVTIHPTIYAKYEDIFNTAVNLLTFLNQNTGVAVDGYEETFFITNSMNKYIHESINSYKTVVLASSRLSDSESEVASELRVRKSCLESLSNIQKQLNASTDKFYQAVADAGMHQMNITNRVVSSHVERIGGADSEHVAQIQKRVMANAKIAAGNQALYELGEEGLFEGLEEPSIPEANSSETQKTKRKMFR